MGATPRAGATSRTEASVTKAPVGRTHLEHWLSVRSSSMSATRSPSKCWTGPSPGCVQVNSPVKKWKSWLAVSFRKEPVASLLQSLCAQVRPPGSSPEHEKDRFLLCARSELYKNMDT